MPLFYFDIRSNGSVSLDDVGQDLKDLQIAEQQARQSAIDILFDEFVVDGINEISIELRNSETGHVLTVTAALSLRTWRRQ